jgi:hypothetical protein
MPLRAWKMFLTTTLFDVAYDAPGVLRKSSTPFPAYRASVDQPRRSPGLFP